MSTMNTYSNGQPQQFEYQNYQDYPLPISPPTPPSVMSDSPPPLRYEHEVRRDPSSGGQVVNHPQSGYDELDGALSYSRMTSHFADPNNPYGYVGVPPQAVYGLYAGPAIHQQPQGYLDSRPTFDDHAVYGGSMTADPNLFMGPVAAPGTDIRWRNPDLHEVIEFLSHPEAGLHSFNDGASVSVLM